MNEGWFKGSFDITKYAYNFYRPEAERQIEWSFPVKYKDFSFQEPCSETKILADLIDDIRPDIIYPLHNAGIGGAYFYLTRELPAQYYESVRNLCEELQIPLDYGEPEEEFIKEQIKPFYWEFHIEQMYEYLKNLGKDPRKIIGGGNNSIGYAANQNPDLFGLIGEIPYIYDEKIIDTSDSGQKRKKFLKEKYALQEQLIGFIAENVDKDFLEKDNALYPAVKKMSNMMLEMTNAFKEDLDNPEYNKNATVAEKFSSEAAERFHLCTFLGEFYRLLSQSSQSEEVQKLKSQTEELIDEQINIIQQNSNIKTIPIKNLVQLQLGCLLEAIKYV